MTSKGVEPVLVVGDGVVAAELVEALRAAGAPVDGVVVDGPLPEWHKEPIDRLKGQLAALDLAQYGVAVLAFSSEKGVVRQIVRDLEQQIPERALFLVSAMAHAATEIASWCQRSDRVVGFGFVPPFASVKFVELTRPLQAGEEGVALAERLFGRLGRETVLVQDSAGLVMPRLVAAIINEAVTALAEGVATADDLDTAMKLGVNYPHGPLEWADMIGLDQVYATLRGVYEEQGEDRYRPAPLLRRMVLAGRYGLRSGQGFYDYERAEEGDEHA
jgi:3-hydroxybutyryl-CoA dehydrogenase